MRRQTDSSCKGNCGSEPPLTATENSQKWTRPEGDSPIDKEKTDG